MPAKSSQRAAAIVRAIYQARKAQEVAAGRDGPGIETLLARELGLEQSHLSHILKRKEKGLSTGSVLKVSHATGIPTDVLMDDSIPFDAYLEHMRPGKARTHETTVYPVAESKSHPSGMKFGLASLEAMQDRIKAIVSELGLDEAGMHYVIARLRSMALNGELVSKWDAFKKAAAIAEEYEMQATTGAGHSNPGRSSSGVFASVSDAGTRRR